MFVVGVGGRRGESEKARDKGEGRERDRGRDRETEGRDTVREKMGGFWFKRGRMRGRVLTPASLPTCLLDLRGFSVSSSWSSTETLMRWQRLCVFLL